MIVLLGPYTFENLLTKNLLVFMNDLVNYFELVWTCLNAIKKWPHIENYQNCMWSLVKYIIIIVSVTSIRKTYRSIIYIVPNTMRGGGPQCI
jgi:hypothetical protein